MTSITAEKPIIIVDSHRCPQNHPCPMVKRCPMGAIEQKGHNAPTVDQALCTRCGLCTKGCPYQAFIAMKDH